jgi:hypothetical protein
LKNSWSGFSISLCRAKSVPPAWGNLVAITEHTFSLVQVRCRQPFIATAVPGFIAFP